MSLRNESAAPHPDGGAYDTKLGNNTKHEHPRYASHYASHCDHRPARRPPRPTARRDGAPPDRRLHRPVRRSPPVRIPARPLEGPRVAVRLYGLGRHLHRHQGCCRGLDRRPLLHPGRAGAGRHRHPPDEDPVGRQPAAHRLAGREHGAGPDRRRRRPRAGPGRGAPAGRRPQGARHPAAHRPRPAGRDLAGPSGPAARGGI
jgi:hypothetical protein